uniref:Terpene cyclase/mutase family member n=1 Tax=Timspurckia oligopyrenoides TaxID=708627 RepID=A0A7S1ES27_9RHOD|mmetsp:Transcript_3314/g.5812  ORF Transcript_3314/g.5812 Transcript_3314/m.5812 type:complete len:763 (+) Transcript_3314:30-2318(+)
MWSLKCERGRQWWEYIESDEIDSLSIDSSKLSKLKVDIQQTREYFHMNRLKQSHCGDQILRTLAHHNLFIDINQKNRSESDSKVNKTPSELSTDRGSNAMFNGIRYLSTLQMNDGHWPGDYGGPMFLMPGLIIVCFITQTDLNQYQKQEMKRYLVNMQNEDGGWGLHIEGGSTMLGTVLNYVALRLLGASADDSHANFARKWILANGSAVAIPSWGKFFLAALGVYDWRGLNPLTPEMWNLPYWLPIHPGRYWCHCRVVYLPQAFVYGLRKRCESEDSEIVKELRSELYSEDYASIDWSKQRYNCCKVDEYTKRPIIQKLLWNVLYFYEWSWICAPLRKLLRPFALKETIRQVESEDRNTNWICIGPVNKVINMLACWLHDPKSENVQKHRDRVKDYLWLSEDGMKMQGYNGSQLWDTAFIVQAMSTVSDLSLKYFPKTIQSAHAYLEMSQVLVDVPDKSEFYRDISKGAWPFSTRDHGWPITDCASEGLKATLCIQNNPALSTLISEPIEANRLYDCVNFILSFQNKDGGWATYEPTRSYPWLELLNPSEVFGDIMIDYSYVECSSSCITALAKFAKCYPNHRSHEVHRAIKRGVKYIESQQRPDGSWYGSWAVCFTYAGWFGIEALIASGATLETCSSLKNGCLFLLSKQNGDGSWGESYLSSVLKEYVHADEGQIVNTAWCLLSLSKAQWPDLEPLMKAESFLVSKQLPNGDWPQQRISGVFNRNCMITYINYRCAFSIWALAAFYNFKKQRESAIESL